MHHPLSNLQSRSISHPRVGNGLLPNPAEKRRHHHPVVEAEGFGDAGARIHAQGKGPDAQDDERNSDADFEADEVIWRHDGYMWCVCVYVCVYVCVCVAESATGRQKGGEG